MHSLWLTLWQQERTFGVSWIPTGTSVIEGRDSLLLTLILKLFSLILISEPFESKRPESLEPWKTMATQSSLELWRPKSLCFRRRLLLLFIPQVCCSKIHLSIPRPLSSGTHTIITIMACPTRRLTLKLWYHQFLGMKSLRFLSLPLSWWWRLLRVLLYPLLEVPFRTTINSIPFIYTLVALTYMDQSMSWQEYPFLLKWVLSSFFFSHAFTRQQLKQHPNLDKHKVHEENKTRQEILFLDLEVSVVSASREEHDDNNTDNDDFISSSFFTLVISCSYKS